jgi:uncharacterized protein YeaO (DUF488 family)
LTYKAWNKDETMTDMEKEAKELLAKAKAEREGQSKKAEPKGAAPASSAEIKKTEGKTDEEKLKEEAAAKAKEVLAKDKEDEVILSKKDEELDEGQKKRKAELVDKEKKTNVQKRFDELSGQIKALESDRNSTKAERDELKAELDGIKKQLHQTPEDKVKDKVKKELSSRIEKYLDEDKELPREDRREMTEEELEEWLMEKPAAAQDWIAGRRIRRYREEESLKRDEFENIKASEVVEKLKKGYDVVTSKYPELDITKRKTELEKEGKSKPEIRKIIESENPKWKVFIEIYEEEMNSSHPKYLLSDNPAVGFLSEMEKRLGKPKEEVKDTEKEELKNRLAELEAENARLSGLDTEVSSTRHVDPKTPEPEIVKKTEELGLDLGLSKEQVKKMTERRKGVRH